MAEGDDERSVPALPRREHLTHEPPLRLQDAVAAPGQQRNPTMRIGRTFSRIVFDAVAIDANLFLSRLSFMVAYGSTFMLTAVN